MLVLAKYLIILCTVIYTLESYLFLFRKKEPVKKFLYCVMFLNGYVILISAFAIMFFTSYDVFYLWYGAAAFLILLLSRIVFAIIYPNHNRLLKNHMSFLLVIGLVIISRLSTAKASRQIVFIVTALFIMFLIPFIIRKVKFIRNWSMLFAAIGIVVLGLVFVIGATTNGAKISLRIAGIPFQPTEFIKIVFVMFLAAYLAKGTNHIRLLIATGFSAAYALLLVLCKDLGSAAIFCVVYFSVIFIATGSKKILIGSFIAGCLFIVAAYFLFSHVKVRIDIWIDPWKDVEGKGYQVVQSMFSIANGDWFGTGLMNGKPNLIPFVESDMVFSVLVEELGAVFGICLILIYINCFLVFLRISKKLNELFYKYIAFGLAAAFLFQVLLTIGGGTKYIPLTGVTLPFISYGGSSILATGIVFAIFQGLCLVSKDELPVEEYRELYDRKIDRHSFEITLVFLLLFCGLIINLMMMVSKDKNRILENPYNVARVEKMSSSTTRGSIYAQDMTLLAYTDEETGDRVYPFGETFAHVVGNVYQEKTGLEALGNYYLTEYGENTFHILKKEILDEKIHANNLITTLDVSLQEACYQELKGYKGTIVIMEPQTGKILAMASSPSYDPNNMEQVYQSISSDQNSTVLLNRATQGLYPPGSTFKIFTLLEFMREHPDYDEFSYDCNGTLKYDNCSIHCDGNKKHGEINLEEAFAYSCNCAFGMISIQLDRKQFENTLKELLFLEKLPTALPYEKSRIELNELSTDRQMVQIGIGQGTTLITPFHLALITSAIANDGVLMKPFLIDYITNADGNCIRNYHESSYKRLFTQEESNLLEQYMEAVTEYGTAKKIDDIYECVGKTGTAENASNSNKTHAWFTGYAPRENPEIVITVLIEESGSSSKIAVPIVNRLLQVYFDK